MPRWHSPAPCCPKPFIPGPSLMLSFFPRRLWPILIGSFTDPFKMAELSMRRWYKSKYGSGLTRTHRAVPYTDDLALHARDMPGGLSTVSPLLCRTCGICWDSRASHFPHLQREPGKAVLMSCRLCPGSPLTLGTLEWGGILAQGQRVLWSMSAGEVCGGAGRCEADIADRPGDVHPAHRGPAGSVGRGGIQR